MNVNLPGGSSSGRCLLLFPFKTGGFMAIGWIHAEDYSFNSFLLMERFQIRLRVEQRTPV